LTLAKLLPTRESGHLVEKRSSKGGEPRGISATNETLRAMEGCLTVPAGTSVPAQWLDIDKEISHRTPLPTL
jgi:hypothetical protein